MHHVAQETTGGAPATEDRCATLLNVLGGQLEQFFTVLIEDVAESEYFTLAIAMLRTARMVSTESYHEKLNEVVDEVCGIIPSIKNRDETHLLGMARREDNRNPMVDEICRLWEDCNACIEKKNTTWDWLNHLADICAMCKERRASVKLQPVTEMIPVDKSTISPVKGGH